MLRVENLNKSYTSFQLKNISFEIPEGYIVGFLGKNGAGKTTTIKTMLNIVHPDNGKVEFFGKDFYSNETEIKNQIGFMFGAFDYFPKSKIKTITESYSSFFTEWDDAVYRKYLKKFQIDENKRITELSAGMKVKYGVALALSHNAKLLILDEPTSGLDPIARDELLDIFQNIIQDGKKSILFSTHITSDLDKCADYILIIKDGEIIANSTKDDLINNHAIISGKVEDLTNELKDRMVNVKISRFNFKGLIERDKLKNSDNLVIEKPNLEDIMIFYNMEKDNEEN